MSNTFAVNNGFIFPVNTLNTYTPMEFNVILLFFFICYLNKVIPWQRTTYIIRQQYTVIKKKIFFTENFYFIICIQCTVTFNKSTCPCASTNHNNFLFELFIKSYL